MMTAKQQRMIAQKIRTFNDKCEELEHTDTQEAWDILILVEALIEGNRGMPKLVNKPLTETHGDGECPECGVDIPAKEIDLPCPECESLPAKGKGGKKNG